MNVGKSYKRVDAFDKVTGKAKYSEDLFGENALIAKLKHSTIAHGYVKSMDIKEALAVPGVVKIITCFDVPDYKFPTAGHPWSTDPSHQDVADRLLLNRHVRYYGDEIAAVIGENDVACDQAIRKIKVEYEELPFVLDPVEAMKTGAPLIHPEIEDFDGVFPSKSQQRLCNIEQCNILAHTSINKGNFKEAIKEENLIKVEGWYETPTVSHCQIENQICYAEEEAGKIKVVASTQIPHITRRVVAQALGRPWGDIRIIKPYIGGGFGNKQDVLYEPITAYLSTQVGGRLVKLDASREETFINHRTRHAIKYNITSYIRKDGTIVARKYLAYSNQGAYASHGHSVGAKGMGAFPQQYPCANLECDTYTVYTNSPTAGAMRGYGIPQAMWAGECHIDDIAKKLGRDPLEYRNQIIMPKGYVDPFSKNENFNDSFRETLELGKQKIDYENKVKLYKNQTGPKRKGIGVASFWYNTAVWPISLESSACRMVLNQDGSIQLQLGETEIGQGADTAFAQMAADATGIKFEDIHVISTQDTDITPFGTGAYASRQTYVAGFSIKQTGEILKGKILDHAHKITRMPVFNLDIVEGNIVRITDGRVLMSLGELSTEVLYSLADSEHLAAESTYQIKSNAYSFGCTFAEVEVDIPMCKVKVLRMINVHDAGSLVNPQLAEAQVHGGMSMALGYGLSEEYIYSEKTGEVLNGNLLDYKFLTSADHPELEAYFVENPEPTSAYGTKSLGEPPTCSGAPAIRNAVLNAVGIGVNKGPLSPRNLFVEFKNNGLFEE